MNGRWLGTGLHFCEVSKFRACRLRLASQDVLNTNLGENPAPTQKTAACRA
jgi:hypothetical protein